LAQHSRTAVRMLLNNGASPADLRGDEADALRDAAETDCEFVKVLVDGGLDAASLQSRGDETLLHILASDRRPEAPGRPHFFSGTTEQAAAFERETRSELLRYRQREAEIGDWLISKGVNPNAISDFGETALMCASTNGDDVGFLKMLIRRGADVNYRGPKGTALQYAARSGNLAAVKLLSAAGADKRLRDAAGKTALEEVGDISSLLKRYGARVAK